jgi:hypothetical protein
VPLKQLVEGAPQEALSIQSYWCRMDRRFVSVPETEYVGAHQGLLEEAIVCDTDGREIGLVGWMRWADGHVIVFRGRARPPAEILQAYLDPGPGDMIFPGALGDDKTWVSRVRPGVPQDFVQVSINLLNRTGYKFSAKLKTVQREKPV